jgi:TetR/AcrR family transcriptional regulator
MATAIAKARRSAPRRSPTSSGRGQDVSNRDTILAAAEALLATLTFSGTHVDAVAAAAGVSKRLVYHYFGDKVGLYREVLWRAHRRWTAFAYFKDAPTDPMAFADGFVCWLFETYRRDPIFVRLIMGENIIEGRYFEIGAPRRPRASC